MRALIDYLARARSRQPFARRVGRPPVAFGRRLKDEAESKAKKPLKGARKLIESGLCCRSGGGASLGGDLIRAKRVSGDADAAANEKV